LNVKGVYVTAACPLLNSRMPARIGILCLERNHGLDELARLTRMLMMAIRNAHEETDEQQVLSCLQEVRAIHQHMKAVRDELALHRAEHGC
jgi:hypothetical protein